MALIIPDFTINASFLKAFLVSPEQTITNHLIRNFLHFELSISFPILLANQKPYLKEEVNTYLP